MSGSVWAPDPSQVPSYPALTVPGGSALIGYIRTALGAVATTVAKEIDWQAANVFDFMTAAQIADVKSGAPVLDHTASIQAAVTASNLLIFGDVAACIFRVSTRINLHDNSHLDLNGSTVNWVGAVVNAGNKANKWDNSVFSANLTLAAPSVIKKNIAVYNGTINVNDWGVAVSFKQVEGFLISDLKITNSQCAGINTADCLNGEINRCNLLDCAANPASGFVAATDLEAWSDGMMVWYGTRNVTVSNCNIVNTRVATGRAGIVIEANSTESLRVAGGITLVSNTIKGYDRQFHAELASNVTAIGCTFELTASGMKTENVAATVWNTIDTTFIGCQFITIAGMLWSEGDTRTRFIGCSLIKNGADTVSTFFRNPDGLQVFDQSFTSCVLNLAGSNFNLYKSNARFTDCYITATAPRSNDLYGGGKHSFISCKLENFFIGLGFAGATDFNEFINCTVIGFAAADTWISGPVGAGTVVLDNTPSTGKVAFDGTLQIYSSDISALNIVRTVLTAYQINGNIWHGTVNAVTAVATTLFAGTEGLYLVYVSALGDAANYGAFATVLFTGATARIVANNGALATLTLAGLNVQVTQNSGGTQSVKYSYHKI